MKRIHRAQHTLLILILCLLPVIALTGCPSSTSTSTPPNPATLAPGYVDSNDQTFAQAIAAAQAFYTRIQNDVNARTYVPSPTELTALNALGTAINTAKAAAEVYHNSPTTANLTP